MNVTDADDCADCDARRRHGVALLARRATTRTLDYLFIDEAGQVSLADALAMGTARAERRPRRRPAAARPGAPGHASRRQRRVGAEAPARRRGRRSRPTAASSSSARSACTRTSARTSRRSSTRGASSRTRSPRAHDAARHGPPLRPRRARGRRQESPEEVARRRAEVERRSQRPASRRTRSWSSRPTTRRSTRSRDALPTAVRVGTVDKFQGQEADVVLYSMASSSGEDVPRGLEFLLSRNRLNVAISRARASRTSSRARACSR